MLADFAISRIFWDDFGIMATDPGDVCCHMLGTDNKFVSYCMTSVYSTEAVPMNYYPHHAAWEVHACLQ